MNEKKEILGVILARGGSKSIPKKSIYKCAGKPLIYYTIKAAQESKTINRLIISTDDEEIASVAKRYGVEVPFMRPVSLAQDKTPDLPVFVHVLKELKKREGYVPDVVVHLRPTTPLKNHKDIDRGVKILLEDKRCDSVRSVCEPIHTPFKMFDLPKGRKYLIPIMKKVHPAVFKKYAEPFNMPRQVLPKIWRHSGYVDIIRSNVISENNSMSGKNIAPLPFDMWRDLDIDSMRDLRYAEIIIKELRKQGEDI
jgi:CMP-N,N'-diacetyllegionaminic acid synthase